MKSHTYNASAYDVLYSAHVRAYQERIQTLPIALGRWQPKSVLAVACGSGADLVAIDRLGWQVELFGSDLDPNFVKEARANLAERGIKATLWAEDLLAADPPVRTADLVVFRGNSLGHFSPDLYPALFAKLHAMVATGGRLVFDFRDGDRYFADRNPIEYLGSGSLPDGSRYLSWYRRTWPKTIDGVYRVSGRTLILGRKGVRLVRHPSIEASFNRAKAILAAAREVGFLTCTEVTETVGQSLKHLRTFVALKNPDPVP